MGIRYESLDDAVRLAMVDELEQDLKNNLIYISPRLTEEGSLRWPIILREAFEKYDDVWIASTLRSEGLIQLQEQRRKRKGGFTLAKVPNTAPDTLAEGEFNRFYVRALCADVISSGGSEVEIYRGKDVQRPRPESESMIGKRIPAQKILDDLRISQGVEPALGLPPGPNSGLSVRRV